MNRNSNSVAPGVGMSPHIPSTTSNPKGQRLSTVGAIHTPMKPMSGTAQFSEISQSNYGNQTQKVKSDAGKHSLLKPTTYNKHIN